MASEFREYIDTLQGIEKLYIQNRLVRQILWYDRKSLQKQMRYKILTILSFIFTASIPCISLFNVSKSIFAISVAVSVIGAVTSVLSAILSLCEYQKLWIQYRINCEMLKGILYRYMTKTGEFYDKSKKEAFHILVSNTDQYIQSEFMAWNQMSHTYKEKEKE